MFKENLGINMNVSTWRHCAIAIARKFLVDFDMELYDDDDDDSDWNIVSRKHLIDYQAAHSSRVANTTYAIQKNSMGNIVEERYKQQRQITEDWHKLLLHYELIQCQSRKQTVLEDPRKVKVHRLLELQHRDLETQLKIFLNDGNAQFRGNQKQTLQLIVQNTPRILQIASTGCGKSLSFMLPSFMVSGGTTIFIVPLVLLQNDLKRRCSNDNISSWIFKAGALPQRKSIVFVTPESLETQSFRSFAQFLMANFYLDRVVIDECHLLLSSSTKFRNKMAVNVKQFIHDFPVQLLLLTATLSISQQELLLSLLNICNTINVERGQTIRKMFVTK